MTQNIKNFIEEGEKEFEEKFCEAPAISGSITDSDECCTCGEDLGLEMYDAFEKGYEMATSDIKEWHSSRQISLIKMIVESIKSEKVEVEYGTPELEQQYWDRGFNSALDTISSKLKELVKE